MRKELGLLTSEYQAPLQPLATSEGGVGGPPKRPTTLGFGGQDDQSGQGESFSFIYRDSDREWLNRLNMMSNLLNRPASSSQDEASLKAIAIEHVSKGFDLR